MHRRNFPGHRGSAARADAPFVRLYGAQKQLMYFGDRNSGRGGCNMEPTYAPIAYYLLAGLAAMVIGIVFVLWYFL
jgi:hypothetical protein